MSTEHQQYSIANQSAAIALYAEANGMKIVRSFVDAGRSGVTITRRQSLQELIETIEKGEADFSVILVYDVSRWGRFPDTDEAGHYEFVCKRAGIQVRYCAEQFANDNSPTSNVLKVLKRMMAGEFSRELSVKVSAGHRLLASLGFRQGGNAPYGMRRQLVDGNGRKKGLLKPRQHKLIHTDHVILTLGPRHEVENIRHAFDLLTDRRLGCTEIAAAMNAAGLTRPFGKLWTRSAIKYLLSNPIYAGSYVYGRTDRKSSTVHKGQSKPQELWTIRKNAVPAIVSEEHFSRAQEILAELEEPWTPDTLLDTLRHLWREKGRLSWNLVWNTPGMPSNRTFYLYFGGLTKAYELIGYVPEQEYLFVPLERIRQLRSALLREISERITAVGGTVRPFPHSWKGMLINDQVNVGLILSRPRTRKTGETLWPLSLHRKTIHDITIVGRLDTSFTRVLDYYVFPRFASFKATSYVRQKDNAAFVDLYHRETLDQVFEALSLRSIPNEG